MPARHQPAPLDGQIVREVQQRIGRRHDAAGEKIPAHPVSVAFGFERIHQVAVHEDMHEQLAVRFQPAADRGEQGPVVAHVLEHFHRNAAVELIARKVKYIDVAGQYGDIGETAQRGIAR